MIDELKRKLGAEGEKLMHELNVTLPQEIRKAVEHGDLKENSEYKAALERQRFVQARLSSLTQRLSALASIDESKIPEGQVGLGSRVVVKDKKTGQKETYHLVFGDAIECRDERIVALRRDRNHFVNMAHLAREIVVGVLHVALQSLKVRADVATEPIELSPQVVEQIEDDDVEVALTIARR
jgi:transcription elongation factor GreA